MSVLVDSKTPVICQGITGYLGSFFTHRAIEYGTCMVAGVVPGHGGTKHLNLPVFDTVGEACEATGAEASMLFVPPANAGEAIIEAVDAGIRVIVCITEGIPMLDMLRVKDRLRTSEARLIGPNCPGIIVPRECLIGIMPTSVYEKGRVGVISRSGTLFYEAVSQLCDQGLGQSTCIGIGADPVQGMTFVDCLKLFADDDETDGVLLIGEIGGAAEEQAAEYLQSQNYGKPIVAYVAGRHAPSHRRMGHAGAIISGRFGGTDQKINMLRSVGVTVSDSPVEIGAAMRRALR